MDALPRSTPLWSDVVTPSTSLDESATIDVCVIGAGIAGMSTAYCLANDGLRVLVVDALSVCAGQTGLTTAHLSNAIDERFYKLKSTRGQKVARLAAESHTAAIDFFELTVDREHIDCGFARVNGYLFAESGKSPRVIEKEYRAARDAGLPVELLYRAPLEEFNTGPCVRFPDQGQLDPRRYLDGLARAVTRMGGQIVTGLRVTEVTSGDRPRVKLEDGRTIRAGSVVVATNCPINGDITLHLKQAAYTTYAIALSLPSGSVPRALYWDTADPFHYVRLYSYGADEYLIVGGEDHRPGEKDDAERCYRNLEKWTRIRFPRAGPVTHQWCGQVMETFDGLAFIGRQAGDDNIYLATGDSGMGMTHGTIAGMLLTDLIRGRSNPWTKLYDPSRGPSGAETDFLDTGLDVASSYLDWLGFGEVDSVDDIPHDSGAVVQDGVEKLAVYRDKRGELDACSAVCRHLGAIVAWNDGAKTWDCPAHGSRYDCHGRVINGPATDDLEPCDPPEG
jgi:glycine/D-amino acid oxidase-like deaminating enzyme/nitrite reductase/ring-hydroxylating ferredoxin subunit